MGYKNTDFFLYWEKKYFARKNWKIESWENDIMIRNTNFVYILLRMGSFKHIYLLYANELTSPTSCNIDVIKSFYVHIIMFSIIIRQHDFKNVVRTNNFPLINQSTDHML